MSNPLQVHGTRRPNSLSAYLPPQNLQTNVKQNKPQKVRATAAYPELVAIRRRSAGTSFRCFSVVQTSSKRYSPHPGTVIAVCGGPMTSPSADERPGTGFNRSSLPILQEEGFEKQTLRCSSELSLAHLFPAGCRRLRSFWVIAPQ